MPPPDPRTRNSVAFDSSGFTSLYYSSSTSLTSLLVYGVAFSLAVHTGRDVLSFDVDVFWLLIRVLACKGLGVLLGEVRTKRLSNSPHLEWSTVAVTSLLLLLRHACFLVALSSLAPLRAVILTASSPVWLRSFLAPTWTARTYFCLLGLVSSFSLDAKFLHQSFRTPFLTYVAVLVDAAASMLLEDIYDTSPSPSAMESASVLGASAIGLPFYLLRKIAFARPRTPILPLSSLAACPLLAYVMTKPSSKAVRSPARLTPRNTSLLYLCVIAAVILDGLLYAEIPSWSDVFVGVLLAYGVHQKPTDGQSQLSKPIMPVLRSYLKNILANPESRKIFYFLLLNLAYMFVQVLYGIWTNSLGLISDAIHMGFDCMAIGVGLVASVMATLPPNERFTYGYGRIETLSGFANGIFLLLISVFIVFEAIERLMDPPEMSTNQLLLISSMGLGVNLFGMFAMGGHHHHGGHSHSHGHSHGPTQSHSSAPSSVAHSHPSAHSHSARQSHSPVHSHSGDIPSTPSHSHSSHGHHDGHSHSHSHSHEAPAASPVGSHSHSPSSPDHGHSHSHSYSQPATPASSARGKQFHGSALQVDALSLNFEGESMSPITPRYRFGHDEHFETHHHSEHVPNLHDHSHGHHDHAHEGHSHNMRGVFLHVMADTLGSVGVIISTLLIQFYGWTGFDPIASLFIAIMIAASVIPLVIDTGKILCLDISDREVSIERALLELDSLEGVASYKFPRFWPKDASSVIGSICIQIHPVWTRSDLLDHSAGEVDRVVERVDSLLRSRIPGLEELTIQVEG